MTVIVTKEVQVQPLEIQPMELLDSTFKAHKIKMREIATIAGAYYKGLFTASTVLSMEGVLTSEDRVVTEEMARSLTCSYTQRLLSCETVRGEACDAEMYPEVKIKPEVKYKTAKTSSEAVEQEYFEYNEPKTYRFIPSKIRYCKAMEYFAVLILTGLALTELLLLFRINYPEPPTGAQHPNAIM
ncbi:hypothetical protein CMV_015415 [Castanea mollissima]|uniref:Uncharacterized protein n=1 Tax=Castanea mollissima TaxID=60419 RepID=A0A8J4RA61_9ROSI|nr:hypothetical protein CMV_015415 [Castanea mollissima]